MKVTNKACLQPLLMPNIGGEDPRNTKPKSYGSKKKDGFMPSAVLERAFLSAAE